MPVTRPEWRFVICDNNGQYISEISNIAFSKHFSFEHCRPAQCTFRVPCDDPRIYIEHTDGLPYLAEGVRTLKAWRLNPITGVWTIRYNGYVWTVTDTMDGDEAWSSVTCMDPWQLLYQRFVCWANGAYRKPVRFLPNIDLALLARALVDRTNANYGITGIATSTAGNPDYSGAFTPTGITLPVYYERAYVGPSLVEITNTSECDIWLDYLDRTDGIMADMSAKSIRGQDRNAAVFGVARPPHNVQSYSRTASVETMANFIAGFSSTPGSVVQDSTFYQASNTASRTKYRTRQSYETGFDFGKEMLTKVVDALLLARKQPRQIVAITPVPDLSATPWDEYFLGDAIFVYASSAARQAIAGKQRVYGIDVDVDDDGFEVVGELRCSFNNG